MKDWRLFTYTVAIIIQYDKQNRILKAWPMAYMTNLTLHTKQKHKELQREGKKCCEGMTIKRDGLRNEQMNEAKWNQP